MSYKITAAANFQRQAKRLIKKFPSLKGELQELNNLLADNPIQGDELGNNCYKIRISIASKGKGKSGGARVITHVYVSGKEIFLLSIYDKSEQSTISDAELQNLLKGLH